MPQIVDRALRLWGQPLPAGDEALSLFRRVYADPLQVNGESTPLQVLVDRSRMMQNAFEGLRHQLFECFEAPGRIAFAFRIYGRHTGPLQTPAGELAPTGLDVEVAGLDIFIIDEATSLVTGVWAIADYLTLLMQSSAVKLVTTAA